MTAPDLPVGGVDLTEAIWAAQSTLSDAALSEVDDDLSWTDRADGVAVSIEGSTELIARMAVTAAARVLTARHAAEVERLTAHSVTLNTIGWMIATALGDVPDGAGQIEANPEEQADRLVAEVERLRAIVADYEHRITWDTTCKGCADRLDDRYALEMAAEQRGREQAAQAIEAAAPDEWLTEFYARVARGEYDDPATPTPAGGTPPLRQSTYYSDLREANPAEFNRIFGVWPATDADPAPPAEEPAPAGAVLGDVDTSRWPLMDSHPCGCLVRKSGAHRNGCRAANNPQVTPQAPPSGEGGQ